MSASRTRPAQDLRDLFSYQIRQLANIYSKGSARTYGRRFGLTMNEWRVIALVHTAGALSINRLAEQAQFDRTLTSRLVATLVDRGYFTRRSDRDDARGVLVSLTTRGRAIVGRVFPEARGLNDRLLSCLTATERRSLDRMVGKLTARALDMLTSECPKAAEDDTLTNAARSREPGRVRGRGRPGV